MSSFFSPGKNPFVHLTLFCLIATSAYAFASDNPASARKHPVVRFWLKGHLMDDSLQGKQKKAGMPALTLVMGSKTTQVHTCQEYEQHLAGWHAQKGAQNMRVFNIYQPCLAKHIFYRAVPADKSAFHKDFPAVMYKATDLTAFSAALDNQVSAHKKTLMSLGLKQAVKSETSLILKPEDGTYRFDLLAKGDFSHDGNEDLLVRFIKLPEKGDAYTLRFLVLTKNAQHKLWDATEAADFIRHKGKPVH